ncbi:thiol reductant ABC exporter subunit CydC [Desulfatiferula olefinivorans]
MPQFRWLLLGLACSAATLLANAALLSLAAWFLACMAQAGISGVFFNYHLPAAGIRALAVVRTVGRYAERLFSHEATFRLLTSLRVFFFTRLEPLAPAGLSDLHSGDVFSRIKSDIDSLDEFYLRMILPILSALTVLTVLFVFVCTYSPFMALYLALVWAAAGMALPLSILRLGLSSGKKKVASLAAMRILTVDLIRGLEELIVFGRSRDLCSDLDRENRHQTALLSRLSRLEAFSEGGLVLLTGLALWGVLMIAIPLVEHGTLSAEELPMLTVLALLSFEGIQPLPSAFKAWGNIRASAERLFSIIDQRPAIRDPEQHLPDPTEWGIEFNHVHFTYPGRQRPVHADFNLAVKSGEKLGLIGPTGSGKTSLIGLLLRFYECGQGDILLGGQPITGYASERLRSFIGVIAQDTYLFNASIRENLSLADPEAQDEALYAALKTAKLDDFVRFLPQALDTQVGQAGIKLSGGQARRLAIARALLKKAPILILDEPTEGLDPETETALWQTLETVMAGKTVILITHRDAGLAYMDRVVSLQP